MQLTCNQLDTSQVQVCEVNLSEVMVTSWEIPHDVVTYEAEHPLDSHSSVHIADEY